MKSTRRKVQKIIDGDTFTVRKNVDFVQDTKSVFQ